MPSVQFRSAADVLQAFENVKCPAWSLWDGKRFMFKGTGRDELESFLDLMNENGASNAVYSLAYYDKATSAAGINSKTPFDGSFNFRLNSDEMEVNTGQYRDFIRQTSLVSKVNGLEAKFEKLLEVMAHSQQPEPEQENKLGIVGEILQHPAIAPILPGLIQSLAEKLLNPGQGPQQPPQLHQPAPVALYQAPARVAGIGNVLEQDQALETAVATLLQYDKKLAEHLTKLAALAQRDPATFNYIMGQLDQMKIE